MVYLGVNIDHVATLRNARGGYEPDPLTAAAMAELGGADGITVHVREDRRHMKERDLRLLRETICLPLNLEMACTEEMTAIAKENTPHMCTLVPEKRQEITTEGGLDVISNFETVKRTVGALMDKGILVSLFIDPDEDQIQKSYETGAGFIELHTGAYAATPLRYRKEELNKLFVAAEYAGNLGLKVNAGHGLNYHNTYPVAQIEGIVELNIGHSIISRAVFTGLTSAVREMKEILQSAYLNKRRDNVGL